MNKKNYVQKSAHYSSVLLLVLINIHYTLRAIDPITLQGFTVRRTTAQIMQGEVASPITASTLTTTPSGQPDRPTITEHFTLADYQETGQYGPSAESSAGSKQIIVASKGRIRSFLFDGKLDNVLNLSHDSFFSPISKGGFTADPNIIFHPDWKQWIIYGNAFLHSTLVLAVSDGDPITSSTVWTFITVDTTSNPGFIPTQFFDYTTLGADNRAIYCAANILDYDDPAFFISAAAYVINRTDINAPATLLYAWRNLANLGPSNLTPFTFQPALNFDSTPDAGYFPSIALTDAIAGSAQRFLVNKVTFNAQNVPTMSNPIVVPVQNYVVPITVPALGTPDNHIISPVASFRLAPAHIRNNRLWLVNNIGVDNNGNSNSNPVQPVPVGTISRDAARFTQIDITRLDTAPATAVVSQGTLFQATPTNTLGARSFLTPSIMSNSIGQVIIGATTTGAQERLNAAVAQLITNNTAVGEPVLYTASNSDYNATEDWEFNPFARWGDHTRTSPDINNPRGFWTAQQWVSATNTWALEAGHVFAN